jgi:hypothetical protein
VRLGITKAQYDCTTCRREPEFKEIWGCTTDTEHPLFGIETDDGGSEFIHRCPIALLRGTGTWDVFALYSHYEAGHLPEAGGVHDQHPKVMRAFEFIAGETAQHEQAKAETREDG